MKTTGWGVRRVKGKALVVVVFLLSISSSSTFVFASSLEKRMGIGLGNPYICIKYHATKRLAYEVRGAFGSGINVYSARVYRNFTPRGKAVTFAGLEGGIISFDKEDIEGDGSFGMLFVGFENSLFEKLTFSFDIGPAYITLSSDAASVGGMEWVYNLGIYYYF